MQKKWGKVAREELSLFFAEKGKRKRRRIGASARAIDRKGKRVGRGGRGRVYSQSMWRRSEKLDASEDGGGGVPLTTQLRRPG